MRDWRTRSPQGPTLSSTQRDLAKAGRSAALATLELAVVRGPLLDLLTTDERERVDGAFALFSGLVDAGGA